MARGIFVLIEELFMQMFYDRVSEFANSGPKRKEKKKTYLRISKMFVNL